MKGLRVGMFVLGGVDWLLSLCQLLMVLITQFSLVFYLLLGGFYFICGLGLIGAIKIFRQIYLYAVIPVSAIAAWDVTLMGGKDMPAYFYTPPSAQLKITILWVLIPLIVNAIFLNIPKVKEQFK